MEGKGRVGEGKEKRGREKEKKGREKEKRGGEREKRMEIKYWLLSRVVLLYTSVA